MRLLLQVVVRLGRKHQPDDVHFRGEIRSRIKPTCPGTKVSLSGRVQPRGALEAVNAGDDRDGLLGQIEEIGDPAESVRSCARPEICWQCRCHTHSAPQQGRSVLSSRYWNSEVGTTDPGHLLGPREPGRATPAVPGQPALGAVAKLRLLVGHEGHRQAHGVRRSRASRRRAGGGFRRFGPRGTCHSRSLCCCGPLTPARPHRALLV